MSGDYSSFERDYFRKQKRREEPKSSKVSPKEIKVYEPKSAQKSIKTQGYADESQQSSYYEYSYHISYTKSTKKKNDMSYTVQERSSPKAKHRGNNKSKALKKDEERNKDNEDAHKDKSFKRDIIWVPASKSKAPSLKDEKSRKANNSSSVALPSEPSELERPLLGDSSITPTGAAKDDRKPKELFNFLQGRPDPIQILKASLEKEKQRKEDRLIESTENISGTKKEKSNEYEDKEINNGLQGEIEENDGPNYSDIDNMVEEKLLGNQIEPNYDTMFNPVESESKETLEALEDKKRPEWEDIDTHQVLKDIKTSDNLDMFSQRIMVPNKSKKEEEQLKEADKEDYFDKIFSFEIREEPMAVMPGLFKFSSDKHPKERCLERNNSICSRSFDLELVDRGNNNYQPLPAFRNFRIPKGSNSETPTKNHPSVIDNLGNYGTQNSMHSSQSVFCKLIPTCPPHAKVWHYRDLEGVLQGPFSSQVMDGWYNKGYLPLDLDVTIANSNGFRKIQYLVEFASSSQNSTLFSSTPNRNNAPIHTQLEAHNNYQPTKVQQNDDDLDETQHEINNSIENIISENTCPNTNFNFRPSASKAFKEADRLHFDCSVNKPYQASHNNQFRGFDYNRNYLRNLPR